MCFFPPPYWIYQLDYNVSMGWFKKPWNVRWLVLQRTDLFTISLFSSPDRSQSFRHSSSVHSSVANVGGSISAHPLLPLGDNEVGRLNGIGRTRLFLHFIYILNYLKLSVLFRVQVLFLLYIIVMLVKWFCWITFIFLFCISLFIKIYARLAFWTEAQH